MVGARAVGMIAGALLLACAERGAPQLELDFHRDPKASFAGFETFAWLPGTKVSLGDPRIDDALLEKRIREAVIRNFEERGYDLKLAGPPSFWVTYSVSLKGKLDVHAPPRGYGFDPTWGGPYHGSGGRGATGMRPDVKEADHGMLVLDVIEPTENELIWRGSAGARVAPGTDSERTRIDRINNAINQLLARFPAHPREP